MKYRNASEILPDGLLKELQKYTQGELLYIPTERKRKKWGSKSGASAYYKDRNEAICHRYFHDKVSIYDLCQDYGLSDETIRKILYR